MPRGIEPLRWRGGALELLDQRLLPERERYLRARTPAEAAKAIRDMAVRGAPLIGVAGAYGLALASRRGPVTGRALARAAEGLAAARPTAVALRHAVDRLLAEGRRALAEDPARLPARLLRAARRVHAEAVEADRRMGERGSRLLGPRASVMTICNTGTLATGGIGTALGVIRRARARRGVRLIYALETRPYLQGARLTAWELLKDRAPFRLLTDGMAGHVLATETVDAVVVGADRIAANGDTANKIGTYGLAVLARRHGVPFYVAAPTDTIDPRCPSGAKIPIEERAEEEVLRLGGRRLAPDGARARHPAFDVTPASLVTALITERGVVRRPDRAKLARLLRAAEPRVRRAARS